MTQISLDPKHVARLDDALNGRYCAAAALEYGDRLIVGLGNVVNPLDHTTSGDLRPPFELISNLATWQIAGGAVSAELGDDDSPTGAVRRKVAVESLVGLRVLGWALDDELTLRVELTSTTVLTLIPWLIDRVSDAWYINAPDGRILAASTDGRMVVVDKRTPVRDWFARG